MTKKNAAVRVRNVLKSLAHFGMDNVSYRPEDKFAVVVLGQFAMAFEVLDTPVAVGWEGQSWVKFACTANVADMTYVPVRR